MLELSRTVRFSVSPAVSAETELATEPWNTWAGWPSMTGVGAYFELTVTCRAEPDPRSGFVTDIGVVDRVVRAEAVPRIARAFRAGIADAGPLLREVAGLLRDGLEVDVAAVTWRLSPFYSLTVETADMDRVQLRQQFEFAAAHRLHLPELSDEENRALFGKCNNPNGHGHNYRLDVAVSRPVDHDSLTLAGLERIVHEGVVQRFDHRHLNLDTPEFADTNPSVEHIARVCAELLGGPVEEAGGRLEEVTVWETEKTCCTYRPQA